MMPSFIVFHPLQPSGISPGHTSAKALPGTTDYNKASILILSKTYPSVTTTSPTLDMRGFLATWVSFAEK
jgi:hypothetical protein